MKKTNVPLEAKTFKFQFTPLMIALSIAVLALCSVSICVSIWRIAEEGVTQIADLLKSPLLILICIFAIVTVIAMLIRSQYVITDEYLILQFGFIKNKYAIKKVTSILLDTDTHKLTVYMGEEYFIIVTNPQWNNDFVQALREVNKDVEFSFTLAEGEDKK